MPGTLERCFLLQYLQHTNSRIPMAPIRTILITGLYAGLLDGVAAVVVTYIRSGKGPAIVYQYIASALLGPTAFSGGIPMVILGIVLHMIIAFLWALIFFLLCNVFPPRRQAVAGCVIPGILYGMAVWVIMNLVVLPLSRVTQGPFTTTGVSIGMSVLILCIGIPIAWSAHRYYGRTQAVA